MPIKSKEVNANSGPSTRKKPPAEVNVAKTKVVPVIERPDSGPHKEKTSISVRVSEISKSAADYLNTKKAKRVKRVIFWSVFCTFVLLFFVFAFLAKYIFGPTHKVTQVAEENILDIFNIYKFFTGSFDTVLRTASAVIIVLAFIYGILLVLRILSRGSSRRKTVLSMIGSFVKYFGFIIMFGWVLAIWGVNLTTILAGAGVIGIVIGLGAQSLISDILSGVFIVFENNLQVGDIITFNNFRGEVIDIGIRTTKTKSGIGDVNIINNSELRNFVNMSKHRSLAICEITIKYGENLKKVENILCESLPKIAEKLPGISEGPDYKGVSEFSDRGVVLRIMFKCIESERFQLLRDVNRELKLVFDAHKIKIAVPQVELVKSTGA